MILRFPLGSGASSCRTGRPGTATAQPTVPRVVSASTCPEPGSGCRPTPDGWAKATAPRSGYSESRYVSLNYRFIYLFTLTCCPEPLPKHRWTFEFLVKQRLPFTYTKPTTRRGHQKPAPWDWSIKKSSHSKTICFVFLFCYWLVLSYWPITRHWFLNPQNGLCVLAGYLKNPIIFPLGLKFLLTKFSHKVLDKLHLT